MWDGNAARRIVDVLRHEAESAVARIREDQGALT
jgi:hypothetical protein